MTADVLAVTVTDSAGNIRTTRSNMTVGGPLLGFFFGNATGGANTIGAAIAEVGGRAAIYNGFYGLLSAPPVAAISGNAATAGAGYSLVTLQPNTAALTDITAGKYDTNLTAWATGLQGLGYPILLRFAHEMNGGWYPWGVGVGTNTTAQYVAAWQHAHTVFQAAGAVNVLWVWCIAAGGQQGPIPSLYPGDPYVDWLSIDGYSKDGKQTFAQALQPAYGTLTGLSAKPVLVAETGCAESMTDPTFKPNWITDAFLTQIPNIMTRIRAVCYFDGPGGGNFTYPWDSSPASQAAMAAVFSSGVYTI